MVDQVLIDAERDNSVSTISSILSGIGSGLIQIPKGAFSLEQLFTIWEQVQIKLQK